jgi:hypothetical protein
MASTAVCDLSLCSCAEPFRTSATNCARLYNDTLAAQDTGEDTNLIGDWPFTLTISADQVWAGFISLALLEDYTARQQTLVVPHSGLQKDRFTAAIQARNSRIRLYGQLELRHHCKKCLRLCADDNGDGEYNHYFWAVQTSYLSY